MREAVSNRTSLCELALTLDLHAGATAFGALVTETLLQRLAKAEDQHLGSTECLLLAALLVEWAHELQEIEVQRERVLDVLSMVIGKGESAATNQAWPSELTPTFCSLQHQSKKPCSSLSSVSAPHSRLHQRTTSHA